MPRKKRQETEIAGAESVPATASAPETLTASPASDAVTTPTAEAQSQDQDEAKNWGPPYKSIYICKAKGFEMGENRRFKQRVFLFSEKPDAEVLAALKENGFTYRAAEKAWTIHADAETRLLSDRLAKQFAGERQEMFR